MKRLCILGILLCGEIAGASTRLREVASLEGVRDNQLMGYGVVVGLNGTGDKRQTVFSAQTLTNILQRMGVTVQPSAIQVRNIAAVMVTASLPPFAQPGTKIDITAAAIGDATNLQGGLLLMTSLKAADGQVYAVAQGPIVTGGFVAGRGGNVQTVNHPTVGRLPGGALVERAPPSIAPSSHMKLQLRQADFTTAARIADALNRRFAVAGLPVAKAESSAVVVDAEHAQRRRTAGRNRGDLMIVPLLPAMALPGIPAGFKPTKVEDAAQQFESLLIHQMMQAAWEAEPGGLGGDDEDDSQGNLMRDLACQQFAQLLARHGGIGLTRLIVKGLSATDPDRQ